MRNRAPGMESRGRYLYRITEDLAGDLAELGSTTAESLRCRTDLPQFAGVILHCEGRHIAAMGFARESDRTLTITDPVFLENGSADIRQQWAHRLLQAVFQESQGTGCRTIRSLQPVHAGASESLMARTLTESGFTKQATVAVLQKSPSSCGGQEIPDELNSATGPEQSREYGSVLLTELLTATQWTADPDSETVIRNVLHQILVESADLPRLPVPLADSLLEDWRHRQVAMVLMRRGVQVIGLCAVAPGSGQFPDELECTTALIQYLGVIPEFRRTGIASSVITRLPQLLTPADRLESRMIRRFKVFCDTENLPARRLYAHCGFEMIGELDVWCREVISTSKCIAQQQVSL